MISRQVERTLGSAWEPKGGHYRDRLALGHTVRPVTLYRSHAPLDTDEVLPSQVRLIIPESTWTDTYRSAKLWGGSLSAKVGYMGFRFEGGPDVGAGGSHRFIVQTDVDLDHLRSPEFIDAREDPDRIWKLLPEADQSQRPRDVLRGHRTKPLLIERGVRWVAILEPNSPAVEFVHLHGAALKASLV